jgi:transcriptional regulator with XRE-family HTH domain
MQEKRRPSAGRPKGTTSFDPKPAVAFGNAVRERRLLVGVSQEELSSLAQVERSHMGKIERGEHMPNFVLILKLANALEVTPGQLVDRAVQLM